MISIALALFVASLCVVSGQHLPNAPDPYARRNLYKGQQYFTIQMLRALNEATPQENTFFSPFSVYNALLLAYFSSANHTAESLRNLLAIPESQDKKSTMQAYRVEKLVFSHTTPNHELSSANRLFVSNTLDIKDEIEQFFADEIEAIDFKDANIARKKINDWIASSTKNQIKELLRLGDVDKDTKLVLANAAYFKAIWKNKFQPQNTRKQVFNISPTEKKLVPMMRMKTTLYHLASDTLSAHVLELPYKGESLSMFILLPPFLSPTGITDVLKRLTPETFREIVSDGSPRPVEVSIPKFSFETRLDLVPVLEKMGVGDFFQTTSDLTSLTDRKDVTFDSAIHQAKITVDEEGTTAAAATALVTFRSSISLDPIRFTCNHPFVFLIYDKTTHMILFVGVYNRPPADE